MAAAKAMSMSMSMSMCSSRNKQYKQQDGERGSSTPATARMRKGPWTEEEDTQLLWFVRLFGERRWDFLAKVSGLGRTGKSCRLRWVNYLHPGLRRGRITADEERLIVELHGKWGSRWSRIARSLPGRTDNEIKNFWRTRARKQKAAAQQQEEGRRANTHTPAASSASSSVATTTSCSASCSGGAGSPPTPSSGGCGTATTSSSTLTESSSSARRESISSGHDDEFEEAEEIDEAHTTAASQQQQESSYTMDDGQFWNDDITAYVVDGWGGAGHIATAAPPWSPVWEYCSDYYSLWKIDDDDDDSKKMLG